MSDAITFKKDSRALSNRKAEAQTVRNCFDSEVVQYLIQFPTESDQKFEYRKSPYISKFTNFVSSAINAASGIALRKLPKVDDDELLFLPQLIGDTMANIGCDGVGYLFVDAPKLESDNQKTNEASITYISIDRVVGDPVKDMHGNISEFVFQGDEEVEMPSGEVKTRKYRKKIFLDGTTGRGEKYVEKSSDSYVLAEDGEWEYKFEGLPVIEIDILTANKHPYIDIANNNLWLYNLESDERNIIHFICSPYVQFFGELRQDSVSGSQPAQVFIGADRARRFNDKTKEGIEITEAKGTGVEHATKKIDSTIDIITRMSASVMTNTNYKTATQAENAESKSLGFLPFVVISIEDAFNEAVEFMGLFRGQAYSGGVTMNKKFTVAEFNAGQLAFVKGLYDSGIITKSTMLDIAKDADLVKSAVDSEQEIREAEEQMGNVA